MSKISIKGADTGTGVFTLESPATNTDRTLVLPDEAGTVLTTATSGVPVNGPSIGVKMANSQNISADTATKIAFDSIDWDTNSCFDTSLYRFTPNVSGYYLVNAYLRMDAASLTQRACSVYKNGELWIGNSDYEARTAGRTGFSSYVYLNGSTDYIELYGASTGYASTVTGGSDGRQSYFSAALVRAA